MSRASERLSGYDSVITIKTRAGLVPVYKVIEKFLWIQDADGNRVPFILNSDQVDLYARMCEQKLKGRPIRANILKARQKGFSTFIAAMIFVLTIFQAGRSATIVADIAGHAEGLFEKYIYFYNNLPDEMKPTRLKSNAKELSVTYGGGKAISKISIAVQGDSAGRSGTNQYVHCSECAFWDDMTGTTTSLFQTVDSTNIDSMIFLETTANGVNDYKVRWDFDFAKGEEGTFLPCFYAWFTTERYRVKEWQLKQDVIYPKEIEEYRDKYHLDEYQMQWLLDKYNEFHGDIDHLRQEFPSNPVEAFITTGSSVFNSELLRKRKEELLTFKPAKRGRFQYRVEVSQDGKKITISNVSWVDGEYGVVKILKDVESGHPYVLCNDPAQGGEDYYAVQVFDNYTGEQVATYHRNKVDADDCAYQMYCLAWYYNEALITGETNTTSYLLEICARCGYRRMYQDQDVEDLTGRYINRYGYKTKQNNRQYMIELFAIAFRDNPKIINDYETICEMESFQYVKSKSANKNNDFKGKAQATGGEHDDLVTAAMGFYLCRGSMTCVPTVEAAKVKISSVDELEARVMRNRQEISQNQRREVYQIWD